MKSPRMSTDRAAPPRRIPAAVLISIHGGPEGQFRPIFTGMEQFLVNELGLAVIAPNVRGLVRLRQDLSQAR